MLNISSKQLLLGFLSVLFVFRANGQKILTIKEAEQIALANYGSIKAKTNQLNAAKANLTESKTEYLPDLTLSGQQDYGTVNSQYGPLYAFKGQGLASSGPALGSQNWNAAFGSFYISTVNWDFFSFGKAKEKVKVQKNVVNLNETDLAQEQFQHEVRVASTYLNLLAAQQLSKAGQDNLNRAIDLQKVVVARVKNGLNPGVDSSQANAEVANAKIALTNAQEVEQEQGNLLAQFLGVQPQNFTLDSVTIARAPANADPQSQISLENHPTLRFYKNLINVSDEQTKYLKTFNYPTFSLVGSFDARGTGFNQGYGGNQSLYTSNYGTGIDPSRYNYLFGIGITWNITTPLRVHYQVKAQKYTSAQYQDEYDLVNEQLRDQSVLAETKISNALKNYNEVPEEVKAATDAYHQKFALYQNGLSNIVDFTQALYVLNRAEVDKYIASNNVWQALLYKAAATGDFGIFINNF